MASGIVRQIDAVFALGLHMSHLALVDNPSATLAAWPKRLGTIVVRWPNERNKRQKESVGEKERERESRTLVAFIMQMLASRCFSCDTQYRHINNVLRREHFGSLFQHGEKITSAHLRTPTTAPTTTAAAAAA